ncbi:MAG: MBL fold metallo-hydrolase [Thermoanaerobaculia bacterium]
MRRLLLAAAVGCAALSVPLGWWTAERPWEIATGWESVPTSDRPVPGDPWKGTALAPDPPRLLWLGHSGFLVEWKGKRLLLDPNLSRRCSVVRRTLEIPVGPADLGPIDAVLVSHAHYDHLDLPTLRGLERVRSLLVPEGAEGYVEGVIPGARVVALGPGETWRLGDLDVVAVPAFHHGNRHHPFASRRLAVGYVLRAAEGALYFAGDTGARNDFTVLAREYAPVAAILPIGSFEPSFPIGRVHLSPEQAAEAAVTLGASVVVPCHFGTFRLAWDAPDEALPRFAKAASARGVRWVMPRLPHGPVVGGKEVP